MVMLPITVAVIVPCCIISALSDDDIVTYELYQPYLYHITVLLTML